MHATCILGAARACAVVQPQSPSASLSAQQLPTPFARQDSQGVEQSTMQGPPLAAGGDPRHDEGAGAFGRAASMPAAAITRSASGQHDDSLRLGESPCCHSHAWVRFPSAHLRCPP